MMIISQYVDIIFFTSLFISLIVYLIRKIRRQWYPTEVFCHFCHQRQYVFFSQTNAFNCVQCLQYNGFSQDGNYNKVINGQSDDTSQTNRRFCRPLPECYANCGQLCGECNVNQEIKVKLLSEFLPFNENKYNEELEEYKRHLENEYKICANCEENVRSILSKPINCFKGFVKELIKRPVSVNRDTDSVFVSQNNMRAKNWLLCIVRPLLEVLIIGFGLILFVFSVNEFQDRTEISFIEFPPKVNQFLYFYLSNQTFVIFCGLMSSLTLIVLSERQSLFRLIFLFLWTLLVLSEFPKIIDNYDKVLFRVLISTLLVILLTINSLFGFIYKRLKQTKSEKKSFQSPMNNGLKGVSNKTQPKNTIVKSNDTRADHLIDEQIKSLSIVDGSALKYTELKPIQRPQPMRNETPKPIDLSVNSSLVYGNTYSKNIIVPAKFNYESIAQTSWVSPFKASQSPSKSPRKGYLNDSPYLQSTQHLLRSSHWINNDMLGLVTPPPSVTPSDTSEFAFANRFSLFNKTNGSSTHVMDYRSKEYNTSKDTILRNTIISQQYIRRESSYGSDNKDTDSNVSEVSGSLSSLTINKTKSNEPKRHYRRQTSVSFNLTQILIFAVFILILFCFVIMLSLPLVFRTSFDLNSMNFHLSIQSVPQNEVCIK